MAQGATQITGQGASMPDPDVVVPAAQEIVLMEAERIRSGRFTE